MVSLQVPPLVPHRQVAHHPRGYDQDAVNLWLEIFLSLDIDRKAQVDLMLLAQAGEVGRAYANHTMWLLLSDWAFNEDHQNLSCKVSNHVKWQRRYIDRPPAGHVDLWYFRWTNLDEPPEHMKKWSPTEVPRGVRWVLKLDSKGLPLPPPECWCGQLPQ